ncbi:MAG: hypothetical protein Q4F21_04470 [Lachnospiraceae bacterium]|nr:hypothetical protein [Lachnospiraceae bacterium]
MKPKQIRFLFIMSLLEAAGLGICVLYAYARGGNVPLAAAAAGLVLMVCSFTGSVFGSFYRKTFKENHNHAGRIGTALHLLVFLALLVLYIIGMI